MMKKRLIILVSLLAAVMAVCAQSIDEVDFSEIDSQRFENAIQMMDNGAADKAIEILLALDKTYPDNYVILYELGYAYSITKEYTKLLKICDRLKNHPEANFQVYQMIGNTLDYMGKRKDAIKAYNEGLKKFPNAGMLYVEQAIIYEHEQDYNQAVALYDKAIEVEPTLDSPYYHLAKLFSMSTEPVWAIIYGETAMIIGVNSDRSKELSKLIYDTYKDNIHISDNGKTIHTTLTEMNTIDMSADSSVVRIPLPIAFEIELQKSMVHLNDTIDLPTLIEIRKGFIEQLYSDMNGYYDIPILDFQRKVLDNGHWEAYNMWLLMEGDLDYFDEWTRQESSTTKLRAFADWFGKTYTEIMPTLRPTSRSKIFLAENLNIPNLDEVSDAKGCHEHNADALRLAQWLFEQPTDSTNRALKHVQQFMIIWATNSDEVAIEIRPSAVLGSSPEGTVYTIFALIEYALNNKVKNPGEEGYCYAVKRVLNFLDKNRQRLPLDDTVERYLQMSPEELDRQLHDDYNQSVE